MSDASARAEAAILGLRLDDGLAVATTREPPLAAAVAWAVEHELAVVDDGRVVLTTQGRLLSNELFARLV